MSRVKIRVRKKKSKKMTSPLDLTETQGNIRLNNVGFVTTFLTEEMKMAAKKKASKKKKTTKKKATKKRK
jgi:hypothetical protein